MKQIRFIKSFLKGLKLFNLTNKLFCFLNYTIRITITSKSVLYRIIQLVFSLIKINGLKSALLITFYQTIRSINSVFYYQKVFNLNTNKIIQTQKVKNDTVFILGSGPSINSLTDKNWEYIDSKDSWGFNFWFCHDFIPNYYFLQSPKKKNHDILMLKIFKSKSKKYKRTNFIIRGDSLNRGFFHKSQIGSFILKSKFNFSFMPELIFGSNYKGKTSQILSKLHRYKFFENVNGSMPIPKFGSTIGELIPLALKLGYKKIVLCGIDMNSSSHFYDIKKYTDKFPELIELAFFHQALGANHPHMNSKIRKHTLKDVIVDLNLFAKENFSAQIYVSNEKSSLFPEILKFDFN